MEPPRLSSALIKGKGPSSLVFGELLAQRALLSPRPKETTTSFASWPSFAGPRASASDAATREAHRAFNSLLAITSSLQEGAESAEIGEAAREIFAIVKTLLAKEKDLLSGGGSEHPDSADAKTVMKQTRATASSALKNLLGEAVPEDKMTALKKEVAVLMGFKKEKGDDGEALKSSSKSDSNTRAPTGFKPLFSAPSSSSRGLAHLLPDEDEDDDDAISVVDEDDEDDSDAGGVASSERVFRLLLSGGRLRPAAKPSSSSSSSSSSAASPFSFSSAGRHATALDIVMAALCGEEGPTIPQQSKQSPAASSSASNPAVTAASSSSSSSSSAAAGGAGLPALTGPVDAVWLFVRCFQQSQASGGLINPEALGSSVLEIFHRHRSGTADDEARIQVALFDLLGESAFELMAELVSHRRTLTAISVSDYKRTASALLAQIEGNLDAAMMGGGNNSAVPGGNRRAGGPMIGPGVSVATESQIREAKARQKAERKAQRQAKTLSAINERIADQMTMLDGSASGSASAFASGGASAPTSVIEALMAAGFSPDFVAIENALGLNSDGSRLPARAGAGGAAGNNNGLISIDEAIASVGAGLAGEQKRTLPEGTVETAGQGWRQFMVPAVSAAAKDGSRGSKLVAISSLHPTAQLAFKGMSTLNRLQSELFQAAYSSGENLLVCAPTGAGKTNVAMLTICQQILANAGPDGSISSIQKDDFKIIYVAPMKALAQEVVGKFSQRLHALGLQVRELTGDMQMTKREIAETQVIVTTPEKWDVITRKGGDSAGGLVSLVKLLIIDEVHLLADDRGAVIESIVARTLRLVESTQSNIRIVGLSATLPNYRDVASFLRVHPSRGLFYFDNSYRPVPLQQTFVGVTENNALRRLRMMEQLAYEKAIHAIRRGKQVMVFVHSRKDTVKTARALRELALAEGTLSILSPFSEEAAEDADAMQAERDAAAAAAAGGIKPGDGKRATSVPVIQGEGRITLTESQWMALQKEVDKSRNQELRELFKDGFGIHHAGMLRSDRGLSERMFAAGVTKILVCTATLAWGVNLPAHTVIIKGTQIYNAEAGGFSDLGMLDVMQIFGRAGRPQFDTSGEGIILTGHEKLSHYLGMLTSSVPIESSFIKALPDHLNAEVVSGTVTNIREAVAWLSYTYLYTRMMKNPLAYGVSWVEAQEDPALNRKRVELIVSAAKRLDACHMVRFDERSGNLAVTDLGRVASHYYIHNGSIETFNNAMEAAPTMDDSGVFDLICRAEEFKNVKVREEELAELDELRRSGCCHVKVKGDASNTPVKVNLLLQAFISQEPVKSFTLISDTAYITQSAGRISRALFEIFLRKGWCSLAERLLTVSKAIDKRQWWDGGAVSALWQFRGVSLLPDDILIKLQASQAPLDELCSMDPGDLGALVRHPKAGHKIAQALRQLPWLEIEPSIQPITRGILKVTLKIWAPFEWNERMLGPGIGGGGDPWWIWIEDSKNEALYHHEYVMIPKKQAGSNEPMVLTFAIPVFEPLPEQYWVRAVSDRWLGLETLVPVSFRHIVLPERQQAHTDLLDLSPLPVSAMKNKDYEAIYTSKGYYHFNPLQTQVFHTVYHTDSPVLAGSPTGSGKTTIAELALYRLWNAHPGSKAVYIAPLKALVAERIKDWNKKYGPLSPMRKKVVELTGDVTPDLKALQESDIIVTTPEKWDGISRLWKKREYVQKVGLIVIDEIHLLGEERGPVLEVIVSRMRYMTAQLEKSNPVRFVGLSTALANARDLADWLGIDTEAHGGARGLYNFRPSVRPIPMEMHIQGFPGKAYCPRMASMNKPTYASIMTYSPDQPALVFVSSRRQTRLTALELIALCATDENPRRFLRMSEAETDLHLSKVKDSALKHTLAFGIGIHHAGLVESDRLLVEELFLTTKIQILVCTSTLAWGVNFPAHLVVIKGTEFYDCKTSRYVDMPVTDILQMAGRAGRPQFDTHGVTVILVHEPKKQFYRRFLYEPFPVESQLVKKIGSSSLPVSTSASSLVVGAGAGGAAAGAGGGSSSSSDQPSYGFGVEGLADHFNAEICGTGSIISTHDAVDYLTWTYLFRRLLQNPSYYGLEDTSDEGVKRWLYTVVDETFRVLVEAGCVVRGEEAREILLEERMSLKDPAAAAAAAALPLPDASDAVAATTLGKIASAYYLKHKTVHTFKQGIDRISGVNPPLGAQICTLVGTSDTLSLTRLLCDAEEFAELPVRHNEDGLNEDLAAELPWAVGPPKGADKVDYGSPHTKAYLLLQARFAGVPLPITDYITDSKGVVDQAIRTLSSLVDMAADATGPSVSLQVVTRLQHLMQCVVMASAPYESTLWQLQGLSNSNNNAIVDRLTDVCVKARRGVGSRKVSEPLAATAGLVGHWYGTAPNIAGCPELPDHLLGTHPKEPTLSDLLRVKEDAIRAALLPAGGGSKKGGKSAADTDTDPAAEAADDDEAAITPQAVEAILRHLRSMPLVSVGVAISQPDSGIAAASSSGSSAAAPTTTAVIVEGGDLRVQVQLTVPPAPSPQHYPGRNAGSNMVISPAYTRRKDWGWWVCVAESRTGELLAIRRSPGFNSGVPGLTRGAEIWLPSPVALGEQRLSVYLISDTIRGIDQRLDIALNVVSSATAAAATAAGK